MIKHCEGGIQSGSIINPQRMHEGYDSRFMCVCYHTSCYIRWKQGAVRLSMAFSIYALYVENALFKSSGDICWPPLPSSLLDELSMYKRDSDGFFSRRLVCRYSDSSYNLTDLTLVIDHWLRFLPLAFFVRTKSADLAYTWYTAAYYIIVCNRHSCGYFIV